MLEGDNIAFIESIKIAMEILAKGLLGNNG